MPDFVQGEVVTAAKMNEIPKGVLGYAEIATSQTDITSEVDVTGATVAVTVTAGRLIRVSAILQLQGTSSGGEARIRAYMDGGSERRLITIDLPSASETARVAGYAIYTPSAGNRTFKLTAEAGAGGEFDIVAVAAVPTLLIVEDLGADPNA